MPIVLVFNEKKASTDWEWDDVEGVRHHFPNGYAGIVKSDEPFVYYRGVRRADGSRGDIEYIGHGVVGDVWLDERTRNNPPGKRSWFCSIENYQRFPTPVSARDGDGYFEGIAKNRLQNIRRLSQEKYNLILAKAFGTASPSNIRSELDHGGKQILSFTEDTDAVLLPRVVKDRGTNVPQRLSGGPHSRRAKQIGDCAEKIVMRFLEEGGIPGANNPRHVANEGEKPGWDIEYRDAIGQLQRVEVKGTTGSAFPNIHMTFSELEAAKIHSDHYWLYLVAACESANPKITRICNPFEKLEAQPVVYRLWRTVALE